MPPHKILRECVETFNELKQGQGEIKAMVFDITDNHLKHQAVDIVELKVAGARREGKLSMMIWVIPVSFTIVTILLVVALKFLGV